MMKSRNSSKLWMIALLVLPFASIAQRGSAYRDTTIPPAQVHQLSIQQAVEYAKKNNVNVKNAILNIQNQEQKNREVTGSAYPQLSASGQIVYNAKLPVQLLPGEFFPNGTPGVFQPVTFGVPWGATYGASVSQILFDGEVFTGLKARNTLIESQIKTKEITEEVIKANVHKIYYQLVVSKTQLQLLDSNIELLKKLNHDTRIIYENGFKEKLDVDRSEVQLVNLITERTTASTQAKNGYLGLKILIGMPVRDSLQLTDTINDKDLRDGVLEASNFNYTDRKEFQASELGIKLQSYDVQRYKLSKIPKLTVNGYYNKNAQRNSFDFFKSGGDWFDISAFTLDLKIPIFTGFTTNAKIAQAKIRVQSAKNQQDSLKNYIDYEVETARNNYTSAMTSVDYQKKNMALAQSVFIQTKKKYDVGTGSQTEIQTAQTDLSKAQTTYINALYTAIAAKIDFLKATGKLE